MPTSSPLRRSGRTTFRDASPPSPAGNAEPRARHPGSESVDGGPWSLDRQRSLHVGVDVAAEEVAARGERTDLVVDLLGAAERLLAEELLRGRRVLVDRDVVRGAVLVVERDREGLVRRRRQVGR